VFHTPTDSKRAADRKAAAIRAELEAERDGIVAERGTVKELVADWIAVKERQGRSPVTLKDYRLWCDIIVTRFGTTQVAALNPRDIDAWYGHLMDEGMKPASVQHLHRIFRALLWFGHKSRDYPPPVTTKVSPPEHRPAEIRPPTPEVARLLLEQLPDMEWARAVKVLAATGCRRGEVVGLRWDNIHGDEMVIDCGVVTVDKQAVVKSTKGRRERVV